MKSIRVIKQFRISIWMLFLVLTIIYLLTITIISKIDDRDVKNIRLDLPSGNYIATTKQSLMGMGRDKIIISDIDSLVTYEAKALPPGVIQLIPTPRMTNGGFYFYNIDHSVGGIINQIISGNIANDINSVNGLSSFWFCDSSSKYYRISRINAGRDLINELITHPTGNGDLMLATVGVSQGSNAFSDFRIDKSVIAGETFTKHWKPIDTSKINELYFDQNYLMYLEFDKIVPRNIKSIQLMPPINDGTLKLLDLNTGTISDINYFLKSDKDYRDANAYLISANKELVVTLLFLTAVNVDKTYTLDIYLLKSGENDHTLSLILSAPIGGSLANHITIAPSKVKLDDTFNICILGPKKNNNINDMALGAKPIGIWYISLANLTAYIVSQYPEQEFGEIIQQPIAMTSGDFVVRSNAGIAVVSTDNRYRWIDNSSEITSMSVFSTIQSVESR